MSRGRCRGALVFLGGHRCPLFGPKNAHRAFAAAHRLLTGMPGCLLLVLEYGGSQMKRSITRVVLCDAVYKKVGLSRSEALAMVELVLKEITDSLEKGETVKLSSFGSFIVRKKKQRIGRNPRTGTEATISPRRIVVFKPSSILKQQITGKRSGTRPTRPAPAC